MAVVSVVVIAGSWYATRDTTAVDPSGAAAYLPPDGHRAVTRVDGQVVVTEDALLPSAIAALSLSPAVSAQVASKHADLVARGVPMWRQTTTPYGGREAPATALLARTDRGLVQLAYADGQLALVFDPPVLVLPDDPADGARWRDEGDALGGLIDYRADTRLRRDGSCWRATTQLALTQHDSGAALLDASSGGRLCPGQGIRDGEPAKPPRPADSLAGDDPDTPVLAGLTTATELPLISTSPLGEAPMEALRLDLRPVAAAGRLVLADANTRDLVSFRRDGARLTADWRAHPGGTITSLSMVGEIVVAGTSDRDLCAYDADGGWLWCRELGDLVDRPGVGLDARTVAVLGQDGVLRAVDTLTGRVRWRRSGVDSALAPVRLGDRVAVVERDGTLRAWDSRTGRRAWTTEGGDPPETLDVAGEQLVVHGLRTSRYDAADGELEEQHPLRTAVTRSATIDDLSVVTSSDGTVATGSDGRRRWSTSAWRTAWSDGTGLLAVTGDRALLVDPDSGRTVTSWALPERAGTWWVVRVGDRPLLVSSGALAVGLS